MAGWSTRATMPTAAADIMLAATSAGVIYALCGLTAYSSDGSVTATYTSAHRSYDPTTNTWTARASFPGVARQGIAYVNAGSVNLAFGGRDKNGFMSNETAQVWSYSTSGNTWTAKAALPAGAMDDATAVWDGSNTVHVVGGSLNGTYYDAIQKYSISGNSYTTLTLPSSNGYGWYADNATVSGGSIHGAYQGVGYTANPAQYGYMNLTTGSFTAYSTQSYAFYCNLAGAYGNKHYYFDGQYSEVLGYRDYTVSPYTFVESGKRTASPTSYSSRAMKLVQQYIYTIGGFTSTGNSGAWPVSGRVDRYDLVFPTAPTGLSPANGSTINNDLATLGVTVASNGEYVNEVWQVARDSAFSTGLRTFYDLDANGNKNYVISGAITEKIPAGASELYQGTWYIRTKGMNGGDSTPWTAVNSFTVSHPPAASPTSPIGDTTLDWGTTGAVTLKWNTTDTSETDKQTAYQIIVEKNSDGTLLLDTGKVASETARSYAWSLPSANKDAQIRWKVRAWDTDDVVGAYSSYAVFRMSDKPTVAFTAPAEGEALTTGQPTFTWAVTASGGRAQASYRLRVFTTSDSLVHDTGVINSSVSSYTPSEQIIGVGSYYAVVDITDDRGLSGSGTVHFSTSFDLPISPSTSVDSGYYASLGYMAISWNDSVLDNSFVSYDVWRRIEGTADWTLLATYDTPAGNYEYHDYMAGSGVNYEYVVTQNALRFSQVAASSKADPGPVTAYGVSEQYWLINPSDETMNILLRSVTDDSFTDEYEQETMLIIGRGRHVDLGTRWGYAGSLTAKIRNSPDSTSLTPREIRLKLEILRSSTDVLFLRTPFGDSWQVGLKDLQFSRIAGVGINEFFDVSIPYFEVS